MFQIGRVGGFAESNMAGGSGFQANSSFDEALAAFEHAAPPSPLRAGAPAWISPGPLRGPLKSNLPRIATLERVGRFSRCARGMSSLAPAATKSPHRSVVPGRRPLPKQRLRLTFPSALIG